MSRIIAMDLSPTNAGVARLRGAGGHALIETSRIAVPPLRVPGKREGTQRNQPRVGAARLAWWQDWLLEEVDDGLTLLVLEGYAFSQSSGAGHMEKAELYGVVRLCCHRRGVEIVEIAPTRLKRFATGFGNADKPRVFAAAVERFGEQIVDHDQADAAWLLALVIDTMRPEVTGWA